MRGGGRVRGCVACAATCGVPPEEYRKPTPVDSVTATLDESTFLDSPDHSTAQRQRGQRSTNNQQHHIPTPTTHNRHSALHSHSSPLIRPLIPTRFTSFQMAHPEVRPPCLLPSAAPAPPLHSAATPQHQQSHPPAQHSRVCMYTQCRTHPVSLAADAHHSPAPRT